MRGMGQATFAELEHDGKKRRTRREAFVEKMDGLSRGAVWQRVSSRFIRRPVAVAGPVRSGRWCARTVCSCSTS